jgi:tetratricopeptide (TPR) repeat protein
LPDYCEVFIGQDRDLSKEGNGHKMMRVAAGIVCTAVLAAGAALAGNGGTESPFSMGAGTRELAMGSADLVYCRPGAAVYLNPAALALAERYSLEAFHSSLFESDAGYQYFGFAVPTMDYGSFGLGVFRLGIDGIEKRDASNLYLGDISDSRLGLYLGYGHTISGYEVGAAVTVEQHSPDVYSATSSPGITLSAGRRFKPGSDRLPEVGAMFVARNLIRPSIKLDEQSVTYPYSVDGGLSLQFLPAGTHDHVVLLSAKLSKVENLNARAAFGVEYSLYDCVGLRAGLKDGEASFGFGLFYKYVGFDYAMLKRDLGTLHTFSLTAGFGLPISLKRRQREERREAEFNKLLNQRFAESNRIMINDLVEQAGRMESSGDLAQAITLYDRALFLAADAGMDTTEISWRAVKSRERLEVEQINAAYRRSIDDARARFDSGDFLGARYFANLALSVNPDSEEAESLLKRADAVVARSVSREQEIERGLMMADSLASYGEIDDALVVARSLKKVDRDDPRVQIAIRKAEFAYWQDIAEKAFVRADYGQAGAAVDSAAVRFPGHPWIKNLNGSIAAETERRSPAAARPVSEPGSEVQRPATLSPEMQREVAATYKRGQDLFEKGRLSEAVVEWERVEALAPDHMSVRDYLVDAYKFLGVELYTQSKLSEAVDVWKKASRIAPDSTEIESYIKRTEHEISKLQEMSYDRR